MRDDSARLKRRRRHNLGIVATKKAWALGSGTTCENDARLQAGRARRIADFRRRQRNRALGDVKAYGGKAIPAGARPEGPMSRVLSIREAAGSGEHQSPRRRGRVGRRRYRRQAANEASIRLGSGIGDTEASAILRDAPTSLKDNPQSS